MFFAAPTYIHNYSSQALHCFIKQAIEVGRKR